MTPIVRGTGAGALRRPGTVAAWLVALVEFYTWAALEELVSKELVARLTEEKLVPPGPQGGERGRTRTVTAKALRIRSVEVPRAPAWLSEESDRQALLELSLRPRDRFLVELLYFAGLRIGEALSLVPGGSAPAGGQWTARLQNKGPSRARGPQSFGERGTGEVSEDGPSAGRARVVVPGVASGTHRACRRRPVP